MKASNFLFYSALILVLISGIASAGGGTNPSASYVSPSVVGVFDTSNSNVLLRGDVDLDGDIDMDDLIFLVNYLFKGGNAPVPLEAGNVDGVFSSDYPTDVVDLVYMVNLLKGMGLLDLENPVITLLHPEEGDFFRTSSSSKNIYFSYSVSDNYGVYSCSLYIDGDLEDTSMDIRDDGVNHFSLELDPGSYDWKVSCIDYANNEAFSNENSFEIRKKISSSSSGNEFVVFGEPFSVLDDGKTIKGTHTNYVFSDSEIDNFKATPDFFKLLFVALLFVGILLILFAIFYRRN